MASKLRDSFNLKKKNFTDRIIKLEQEPSTKLFLLIVANTIDPEIGKGCRQDIKSIRQMFKKLSHHMKFDFLELVVMGTDYSKKNVLEAIDILKPGSNDIVVFYYTGHGFSYRKDKDKKFPQVDLRSHPASNKIAAINENTHNLAELFQSVKSKGARLNIVIGDCCNNTIKFKRNFKVCDENIRSMKRPKLVNNKKTFETIVRDYTL